MWLLWYPKSCCMYESVRNPAFQGRRCCFCHQIKVCTILVGFFPSRSSCSPILGIDGEGQLVGFAEDEMPLMIQLEGRHDLSEFWQQQEAIALLQEQTLNTVSDSKVLPPVQTPLPPREQPVLANDKRSLLGSKSKSPQVEESRPSVQMRPATVSVNMEEVYFRTENAYGLMETLRRNALLLAVQVNC